LVLGSSEARNPGYRNSTELNEHWVRVGQGARPDAYDDAHLDACWSHYNDVRDDEDDELEDDDHPLLAPVTEEELRATITTLKNSGATGPDCIPTAFLKHADDALVLELTRLANLSLAKAHFPSQALETKSTHTGSAQAYAATRATTAQSPSRPSSESSSRKSSPHGCRNTSRTRSTSPSTRAASGPAWAPWRHSLSWRKSGTTQEPGSEVGIRI
jgi:hypothetical protein